MKFDEPVEVDRAGYDLLRQPILNKGTAFTDDERHAFHLHGLLPPHVSTLDVQVQRRLKALDEQDDDFERYTFLRDLQDANETLFYALLAQNLEETLPLVYTPTVGEGCQRFSEIWRVPRGLFLSYPNRDRLDEILGSRMFDDVKVIVVTDGERILGLGDQGAGGMGIPIGKLSLYTACAGIHPSQTLPILLDVGTDNAERLADPLYIGWRHERVRGDQYDAFVEAFVAAVMKRWPNVLLQWEDFALGNASRLLGRYRDRLCTFNDDIQGTAAVAVGTLLAAIRVTGVPLTEQRVALFGAGSAGIGIATLLRRAMVEAGLSDEEAGRRFFAIDRPGLLVEGNEVSAMQAPFAQRREAVADFPRDADGRIGLQQVMAGARPTVLIGVSGVAGAFTEGAIREMARHVERPVIFPLSNPTSRSEAAPANVMAWTDNRALVGVGSPFPPFGYGGRVRRADQTNNAYIFPGVGLGVLASGARRVSQEMFMAAARALAGMSPAADDPEAPLLPPIADLRRVAMVVAHAVAHQAQAEGLAEPCEEAELEACIAAAMWEPVYRPYKPARVAFFGG